MTPEQKRIAALEKLLAAYVDADDTLSGGKWERLNAQWLKVKRDSIRLLAESKNRKIAKAHKDLLQDLPGGEE